jgi:hypothetical protein
MKYELRDHLGQHIGFYETFYDARAAAVEHFGAETDIEDETDGNGRALVWRCTEDSIDDSGQNACGEIIEHETDWDEDDLEPIDEPAPLVQRLTITFDNFNHHSMTDSPEFQVSSILSDLAIQSARDGLERLNGHKLRDTNGNQVGLVTLDHEDEPWTAARALREITHHCDGPATQITAIHRALELAIRHPDAATVIGDALDEFCHHIGTLPPGQDFQLPQWMERDYS